MEIKGLRRAQRVLKKVRKQTHAAVILCYHRVVDLPVDLYRLAVSHARFSEHINLSHYTCSVMALIADFSMACTTNKGNIEPGDDMLQVNRCEIHNWDLETLIQEVESFFLH